ncbi:hypothetical protein GCM10009850_075470 [Nonomuraea monospora]|uniref:Peptidase C14 caspase domain-containing protein n=1 Tax=Nonomuraea monospora TaxID=568818 RepID=A0ABN3CRM2_9ACTN
MSRRLALLVATYEYADAGLSGLTAPAHDAEAFAAVLRDPEIAGFEVTTLINEPHHRVGEAIGDFYRDRRRDDLTLLYFTGHGLKDDHGRLYLAMSNTRRDSLLFTALSADHIDQAMEGCASRQKVLVLDCCYSGAYPTGSIAKADTAVHTLERFQGRGRTVLTASDATQYSFEGDRQEGRAPQSVFTRYLVEGLRDGSADLDGDGDITLDELYGYVHDRVVEEMPQQRPKKQSDVEGRTVIARNVNWTLPAYLRNALGSPIATDRRAALDGLAHLHRVGNGWVRGQVLEEIRRLVEDDSKVVSGAAEAWLRSIHPPTPPPPAPPAPTPTPAPTPPPTPARTPTPPSAPPSAPAPASAPPSAPPSAPAPARTAAPSPTPAPSSAAQPPSRTSPPAARRPTADKLVAGTRPARPAPHPEPPATPPAAPPKGGSRFWPPTRDPKAFAAIATALALLTATVIYLITTSSSGSDSASQASGGPLQPTTLITGLTSPIDAMTFTQGGKTLITVGHDKKVRRWDATTGKNVSTFTLKGPTNTYAFSPDGGMLATAGLSDKGRCTVRLWDTDESRSPVTLTVADVQAGCTTALDPGGETLAVASGLAGVDDYTNRVHLVDVNTRKVTDSMKGHTNGVGALRFSPDGTLLASSGYATDTTRLWDVAEGRGKLALPQQSGSIVRDSAFSSDGARLATLRGDDPGTRVQVWDVATGKELGMLTKPGETYTALGFAPDGGVLAAGVSPGTGNGGVLVREVVSGSIEAVYTGHTGPLLLAFSQDGGILAAAGSDGTIRLWPIT